MNYSEVIANNPVRFFHRYCKSKGIKVSREDTLESLIHQLKIGDPKNEKDLVQFLNIIDGSKGGSFILHLTPTPIPALNQTKHVFKTVLSPIEKREEVQNISVVSYQNVIHAEYSVFTRYGATGPNTTYPVFDKYVVHASTGEKTVRTEGNLTFLTPVSIVFCNSLDIANFDPIRFDDTKFAKLQELIEDDDSCTGLKILKHDKKVMTGSSVDTLGFKSKGKTDLQDFIHGQVESEGKFIGSLSTLLSNSEAETIIDEQKYCFDFLIFGEVRIEVILSVNRKGLFSLNQVPRCIYDFVGQVAAKL